MIAEKRNFSVPYGKADGQNAASTIDMTAAPHHCWSLVLQMLSRPSRTLLSSSKR